MILGIDIDDTITDTSKIINLYLKREYPEYDDYHKLPKSEYRKFLKKYIRQMRYEYPIKDGVKEAWKFFKENDIKVIIITARNKKLDRHNLKDTKKFLEKNGIFYDKIYFKQKKKGKKAYKCGVDLFIDDKEYNLLDVSKYNISCVCMRKSERYKSFDNWQDLLLYIKECYHGRRKNT